MTGKMRVVGYGLLIVFLLTCWVAMIVSGVAAQSGDSFKLRVDVDLVTIEVAAMDKDGKPARNLRMEDFQLYEDGKKQEIISFDEVSETSGASPKEMSLIEGRDRRRGKVMLLVFVDCALSPRLMQEARESAERFVMLHMRPQDLFAVATYEASMRILQNFTNDRQEVLAAIGQPGNSIPAGGFYFDDLLRSLEQVSLSVARLKGQKTVLFYGPGGFGYTPGILTVYGNTVKAARKSNVVFCIVDPMRPGSAGGSMAPAVMPSAGISPGMRGPSIGAGRSGGVVPVTLKSLATDSGGISIENVMDYDSELDRLDQQISNYYVVGFQSKNPKHDGAFRKIEVKTSAKGVSLRHRPGYQDRSPVDVLASSRQEKALLTALATPGTAAQLPVTFRPLYFYDSPRSAKVLIAARVRLEKMAFKKKGNQLAADLNIMGVAYAEDGGIAARFSEPVPVSFEKEQETEFRKRNLAYRNYFKLRPGKYRLKLAVSDESNNLGAAEQILEVPSFPANGIVGSSLVIAEQTSRLPDLIRNLQSQMLDETDPLVYSGIQIEPGVENRLPSGSAIPILFRVYSIPGNPEQWELLATAKLVNERGEALALEPISLKKSVMPLGNGGAAIALTLPFRNAPPGKYRLTIDLRETLSAGSASLQGELEFVR